MKVGFIGLGLMGEPMAQNLIKKYTLNIYNRTKSKAIELEEKGANWFDNPKLLADNSDIVILMLADNNACEEVILGDQGIINTSNKDCLIVNMSTVTPTTNRKLHRKINEAELQMIEAPVSGTIGPAKEGTLTILVGGGEGLFRQVKSVLNQMGKETYYIGPVGKASEMKLLINLNLAAQTAIFAETMILGQKLGMENKTMLELINNSAVATIVSKMKGENMLEGNFPTNFPLKYMVKDINYGLKIAEEENYPSPLSSLLKDLYVMGIDRGEEDFSAIMSVYDQYK